MKANKYICGYTNKVMYDSENEAIIALGREARHDGRLFRHYFCKKCGAYHLATMKKKREQPDESLPD